MTDVTFPLSTILRMHGADHRRDAGNTFAQRVLDHTAGAVLVVDALGNVAYANRALLALTWWDHDEVVGRSIIDHIHPDDRAWVAEAFAQLVDSPEAAQLADRPPWASIRLRLLRSDGAPIPVEVTGHGGVEDAAVRGVVYDIRPAYQHDVLGQVLRGIAAGDPVARLLELVIEMLVAPPLAIDAVVLQPDESGRLRVAASTSAELGSIVADADTGPWSSLVAEPTFVDVAALDDPLRSRLLAAGFVDLWHIAVESRLDASTYRIVACTPDHHVPATGVIDRVRRASELAGVVLVRSQTDEMLAHAASHDALTRLPNRVGFRDRVAAFRRDHELSVVLFIDLDGFKEINDCHGHQTGDHVLAVIADRLRAATRPHDLVVRVGGDEFVVILPADPATPPREQGEATANRIVELVGRPIELDDLVVEVAASVGVVMADGVVGLDELDDLIADADAAMYAAKRAGGGRHVARDRDDAS